MKVTILCIIGALLIFLGGSWLCSFAARSAVAARSAGPTGLPLLRTAASSASLLGQDGVPITVANACNSPVFAQIPGNRDYFLGRILGNGGPCADVEHQQWGIGLFRMDWNSRVLNLERLVFRPATRIVNGGRAVTVHHAAEPSVVSYNGELWVAFECATGRTSTCVGPLDWRAGSIDPRRTTEVVRGVDADRASSYLYAASVPVLFVFRDRLFLYWSAIRIRKADHVWEQVTIRGMRLEQERSGPRLVWGAGSPGAAVASYDPSRNVEVAGLNPGDPYSNQTIGLKGVYADRDHVYLFTSLGGRGPGGSETCLNPRGRSQGCFRLQIFRSSRPLGADIFNPHPLVAPKLPPNPAAYQRPFIAPDGTLRIIGAFRIMSGAAAGSSNELRFPSTSGSMLISYPLPIAEFQFR